MTLTVRLIPGLVTGNVLARGVPPLRPPRSNGRTRRLHLPFCGGRDTASPPPWSRPTGRTLREEKEGGADPASNERVHGVGQNRAETAGG